MLVVAVMYKYNAERFQINRKIIGELLTVSLLPISIPNISKAL